ncbi:MAG TPA: lipoate--protein ligase family protein [Methylomirabilota bacterium]|nr:lipoate--protein ligase family protein [Methylomirabilota bacterium]
MSALPCFDRTFATPAENVAADEALLDWCETTDGVGALRFWESDRLFVVVGYGNHVDLEVNVAQCRADGVPILRRCSGGGTVLQGPGCLNYAVVLPLTAEPALTNVSATNRFFMTRIVRALSRVTRRPVAVMGHTDLAIGGLKFSGNAQRRKARHVLFHGTFLIDFDLPLIGRYLPPPSREPAYRAGRAHGDFLTCLSVDRGDLKGALRAEWGATPMAADFPTAPLASLVAAKYGRDEYNLRR